MKFFTIYYRLLYRGMEAHRICVWIPHINIFLSIYHLSELYYNITNGRTNEQTDERTCRKHYASCQSSLQSAYREGIKQFACIHLPQSTSTMRLQFALPVTWQARVFSDRYA